uniref:Uncharacterized protein n=1 Tax=Rhizophagus irregularis (strain DAOM 181602 / DAOM 197198 / MUCL 43194) TaxID=747089 RepID=U9TIW0_RHIID
MISIPWCTKCDYCKNYFKDLPKSENIKNDVIHLLKVITAVTEFLGMKNQLTSSLDIVHVFAKANNNNIKEKKLSFLLIYNQNYNKTLRQFEDILRLLDKLIVKELVKVRVDLKKANTSTSSTQLTCKVLTSVLCELGFLIGIDLSFLWIEFFDRFSSLWIGLFDWYQSQFFVSASVPYRLDSLIDWTLIVLASVPCELDSNRFINVNLQL